MRPIADLLTPQLVRAVIVNGNYGSTMFFVIPGYLIAISRHSSAPANEALRRRLRPRRLLPIEAAS